MGGGTDSATRLRALLAELDECAQHESWAADELAASAWDHARWGLADMADELRRLARRHRVKALITAGQAAACRVRVEAARRSG